MASLSLSRVSLERARFLSLFPSLSLFRCLNVSVVGGNALISLLREFMTLFERYPSSSDWNISRSTILWSNSFVSLEGDDDHLHIKYSSCSRWCHLNMSSIKQKNYLNSGTFRSSKTMMGVLERSNKKVYLFLTFLVVGVITCYGDAPEYKFPFSLSSEHPQWHLSIHSF